MPVRLNYTNRSKLMSNQVGVRIQPDDQGPATFDLEPLNLDKLRPEHGDARIFVEAYQQSMRMRFNWGTVAAPAPPSPGERRLAEFDNWQRVLFRVKITDMTCEPGKLIAWRNKIRPAGPEDHPEHDLLHFENAELAGQVWDLYYDDDLGPIVQVDQKAGDCHDVGGDPKFKSAVYPEIMRRTLIEAFIDQKQNGDDKEHWSHAWLEGFLKPQLGMDDPPELDEEDPRDRKEWINEAVGAFARKHRLSEIWNPEVQENS